MLWDAAEVAIKNYITTAWASSAYASTPLVWENDTLPDERLGYVIVTIEGIPSAGEGSMFGGTHLAVDAGIVFYHSFGPSGGGKAAVLSPAVTMGTLLQYQIISTDIKFDKANPPSPADTDDNLVPNGQPGGNYYRVSGSCPFIVVGTA